MKSGYGRERVRGGGEGGLEWKRAEWTSKFQEKFEISPDQLQFKLQTVYRATACVFRKGANRKGKFI